MCGYFYCVYIHCVLTCSYNYNKNYSYNYIVAKSCRTHSCTHSLHADVTLTVVIVERPEAVRPITGETVVFSCEVRSSNGLLWQSSIFEDLVFVRAIHDPGFIMTDTAIGMLYLVHTHA